jgi:hypothetical protein
VIHATPEGAVLRVSVPAPQSKHLDFTRDWSYRSVAVIELAPQWQAHRQYY